MNALLFGALTTLAVVCVALDLKQHLAWRAERKARIDRRLNTPWKD